MSDNSLNTPETSTKLSSFVSQVWRKLSGARAQLARLILDDLIKKTGSGQYQYLELHDFLPHAHEIFASLGLCAMFEYHEREAYLRIVDVDFPFDHVVFTTPVVPAQLAGKSPDAIKCLGATQTYLRRYLWIQALELAVPDNVDFQGSTEPKTLDAITL